MREINHPAECFRGKRTTIRRLVCGSGLWLMIPCAKALANPVIPNLFGLWRTDEQGIVLLILTVVSLGVEYILVRNFLRQWVETKPLTYIFLITNAITFIPTQLLAWIVVWGAELYPLIVEPFLYSAYFRRRGIQVPGLKGRIVAANFVGFMVGVLIYGLWFHGTE